MASLPDVPSDHPTVANVVRVRSADGVEADLRLVVPSAARFGVIWLPALGVSARHYETFAKALADVGVASAVHEWRGTGSSTIRASRTCNWGYRELLEFDIGASASAAHAACPNLSWVIAGHSLGGQLAGLFAALNPGDFAGLALVASGTPYWRAFEGKSAYLLRAVPLLIPPVVTLFGYYPGKLLGFAGREARGVMRDWARTIGAGRYAGHVGGIDSERALGRLSTPVLGIRLSGDRLGPSASLDWLLGKLAAARIDRVVLSPVDFPSAKANHFSWMKEPAPVAAVLMNWLDAIASKNS